MDRKRGDLMITYTKRDLVFILGLVLIAFGLSGCDTILPPKPIHVTIPAQTDYSSVIAWEIGKHVDHSITPDILPNPGPTPDGVKVGDTCPTCEGRGKSGDGIQPCYACKGDGRVDNGDPILTSEDVPVRIQPTLAPKPLEPRITEPIEILVAKYKNVTVYSILVNGVTWTYDEEVSCFVNQLTGDLIPFSPGMIPLAKSQYVVLSNGSRYPIIRKNLMVRSDDVDSRTNEVLGNGTSPN
jgi:hypothetical protein